MESLAEETWDVLIVGTSLPQALLALSLSRSGLKILHVDRNDFYGGLDAALSLSEADKWAKSHNGSHSSPTQATIMTMVKNDDQLHPSRSYTLSLKPQIVYAQSRCLPSLVSSRIHTQLEFHAVGPWWILKDGRLQKIPSNREDVFADNTLSHREKRGLMKFLRFVVEDESVSLDEAEPTKSLQVMLAEKFSLPASMQVPVLALSLASQTSSDANFHYAVSRIKRHIRSMNYFGPGFAAVTAKYGSNAEVAQVACRSCAVGGGVYLLGYGLESLQMVDSSSDQLAEAELSGGTRIKTKYVIGSLHDLPAGVVDQVRLPGSRRSVQTAFQIAVVSNPLKSLFPPPPENGSMPASAIVFIDDGNPEDPPTYLQVHSEDTGECPAGQCVIYASTRYVDKNSHPRLSLAIETLLKAQTETDGNAEILWTLTYVSEGSEPLFDEPSVLLSNEQGNVLAFPERAYDIAFEDSVLEQVKAAWNQILGKDAEDSEFMRFDDGRGAEEEEG